VHDVLEKLDRYSSGSARDMHARGKTGSGAEGDSHTACSLFVRTYLLKFRISSMVGTD